MLEIQESPDIIKLCHALSTPIRLRIVRELMYHNGMNLNELAESLSVTNGAMTSHIKLLSEIGLIRIEAISGKRGTQKRCYLQEHKVLINLLHEQQRGNTYLAEIPVGSYMSYRAEKPCGLATSEKLVGGMDDPRFFDDPLRIQAGMLWFGKGYVEYGIPNYMEKSQRLVEMQITQEIASEAVGFNEDWPSDIFFSINGRELGFWTSPGDFGIKRGLYTPEWILYGMNQYGLLKPLVITAEGSFVDGQRIGSLGIDDLGIEPGSEIRYRLSVKDGAKHVGGLTIYGKGFGNYGHGILVRMLYEQVSGEKSR